MEKYTGATLICTGILQALVMVMKFRERIRIFYEVSEKQLKFFLSNVKDSLGI